MIDCSKTENYLHEKNRMTKTTERGICTLSCGNCPLGEDNNGKYISCLKLELKYPRCAIQIVQGWSNANPPKTFLSEFLRHFPKAAVDVDGVPRGICPYELGLTKEHNCTQTCEQCWNHFID